MSVDRDCNLRNKLWSKQMKIHGILQHLLTLAIRLSCVPSTMLDDWRYLPLRAMGLGIMFISQVVLQLPTKTKKGNLLFYRNDLPQTQWPLVHATKAVDLSLDHWGESRFRSCPNKQMYQPRSKTRTYQSYFLPTCSKTTLSSSIET